MIFPTSSEDALSVTLYFVTVVTSLGAAGATAETCDFVSCSDRAKAFTAFGFLTAFIAIPLLVAYMLDISSIKRFEIFVSPVVVLLGIVACAIGTSGKSGIIEVYPLLMWYSLMSASAAMFLAFKNSGNSLPSKEKIVDPNPVSVPLTGSVASSIPAQPVQPTPTVNTQPGVAGTPYSAPTSQTNANPASVQ